VQYQRLVGSDPVDHVQQQLVMRTARDYHVKPVDNSAVYYTDVSSSSLGCNSSG